MGKTPQNVAMGFTPEPYPAGTHMCLIYSDEAERRRVISKFLEAGLAAGEKVAYFGDKATPEEVQDWLEQIGVPPVDATGRLTATTAKEVYYPNGVFTPQHMLDTLCAFYQQSIDEHYSACRGSGEMSWALKGVPGSERLMEYEARINEISTSHPLTPICQYDARLFDGATLLDVLNVHPMMIVHGRIVQNPSYTRTEEFLKAHRPRA